ncbi:MAG TPA: hypothetical protein VFN30_14125 [Chitinophagaceae bacterium]|nr:hypothetical protein [Chitinophagaceae bacterium]
MRRITILFFFASIFFIAKQQQSFAQAPIKDKADSINHNKLTEKDSVSLDVLNAPANPAFNLLGISVNAIERPTDLSAFALSIKNATNSFTKLPSSYAVELSPAALFNIKGQTLDNFNKPEKYSDLFWQTLSISLGVTRSDTDDKETDDSTSFTKLGFGLKFSIVRPKWTDSTRYYYDEIVRLQSVVLNGYDSIVKAKANSKTKVLEAALVEANQLPSDSPGRLEKIQNIIKQLSEVRAGVQKEALLLMTAGEDVSALKQTIEKLKASAKKFKIERKGGFLDFTSGLALDFPDNKFSNSLVSRAGMWLTGGYEGGNKTSVLGILRYLFQPDKIFADDNGTLNTKNISTFDAGARIVFSGMRGKFSFSAEGIYRSVLNEDVISPSWRLVFNTEYDVGFNQKLTLSIGRNFNGTISKDGTVIAALNFIKGFGTTKKISK